MNFFSLDSKFNQFMSKVFNLMMLNFMFLILSVPIVTIGVNLTSMYYVLLKMAKGEDPYIWKNFWKSWRLNFKQATAIWLILLGPIIVILFDLFYADTLPGIAKYFKIIFWMVGFVLAIIFTYVFPILSRFDNTVKNLLKNSLLMAVRHAGWTLVLVLINLSWLLLYAFATTFIAGWLLLFMMMLGFSTIAFGCSYIFATEIFPYYEPHEEDELDEEEDILHAIQTLENMDAEQASSEDDDLVEEPVEMIEDVEPSDTDSSVAE